MQVYTFFLRSRKAKDSRKHENQYNNNPILEQHLNKFPASVLSVDLDSNESH